MQATKQNNKLKAGALQYSIFVALILAIIMLALIQLSFYTGVFSKRTALISDLHTELNNTIISYTNGIPLMSTNKNTIIDKSNWGSFELLEAKIKTKSYQFEKVALLGGYIETSKRKALYLVDTHSPLVMAGHANIVGDVLIPKQGVKRGYIGGEGFYGSTLLKGKINESSMELPNIIAEPIMPIDFEKLKIERLKNDSLSVSFLEKTRWFYSDDTIYLNNIKLMGNIIVESKEAIIVDNKTQFTDIILKAKNIDFLDKTNFTGQAIATNSVKISKNCIFKYPSSIFLNAENDKSRIVIEEDSKFTGTIIFSTKSTKKDYTSAILIKRGVVINGEVYSNKNIELLGDVNGTVYTKKFVTHAKGGIYDNHLYNGKININKLEDNYTGLVVDDNQKRIIKWLY